MQSMVHVVDDDNAFRESAVRLLRASGFEVREYRSAKEFINSPPEVRSGCILLDVRMPDVTGPQLQGHLKEIGSILPIVFLTGHGDIPTSVEAMKAGAEDFLSKPVSTDKLVDTVTRALGRYNAMHEQQARQNTLRALASGLTPRERQVFLLVIKGKQNKQIAYELGTTERTIKAHRQKVMGKLQCRSLTELIRLGERLGLIAVDASKQN